MKRSCVIYDSWGELFIKLPNETAGKLIKAISEYCFKGSADTDDPVVDAMFAMIKTKLDEDAEKYEEIKKKRKKAVQTRWENNKTKQNDLLKGWI